MPGELTGYDFSISAKDYEVEKIREFLGQWCKQWIFQKEEGDGGFVHYQGRCRLIKKRLPGVIAKKWRIELPDGALWIRPTVGKEFLEKEFCYQMKADTRIEGPWKNDEPGCEKVVTRQLREFMARELFPWQKKVVELAAEWDVRSIHVILDTIGGIGKSEFVEWMEYNDLGYDMPPFLAMEDIMQCAMGIPAQKCYLIDMPRGMKKDKLASFFAGIEALKNGVMYDKRYAFKKRRIDRPQIIIFTNTMPDVRLLSIDRWKFWIVNDDMTIAEYKKVDLSGDPSGRGDRRFAEIKLSPPPIGSP